MSGVDNRIVTMQFNNSEFERNAHTSLTTLQKIKESMNFGSIAGGTIKALGTVDSALSKIGLRTPFSPMIQAANKGLGMIGGVLDRVGIKNPFASATQGASDLTRGAQQAGGPAGMGVLEGGITSVSNKFLALTTIALTALSNITNRAINAGTSFVKSFTFAPVMDGLHEYETNLKAIQTVQANTDRPLPEINSALEQLNAYSDQTIYNFGEMAKNVGTFTAAGVDLETSVSAIKGIANMAALSGSNSQQAATAMYQLSQALASGKVGLMDWNSVVNAGMGGKKLQGALAQTAIAMGEIDAAQVKGVKSGEQLTIMGKSFRESIMANPGQESWLTSGVLQNSLAALDGRYSKAALSAELLADGTRKYKDEAAVLAEIERQRNKAAKDGVVYSDEQFRELQKLSTSAFEAATKVKTLGQVFEIAKETIGSGWSASFKSIFGDLEEAKKLFTGMSEGLGDILKANALARNNMLAKWNEKGGRTAVIEGLKDAWEAVWAVIQKIGKGFRDIFPKNNARDLIEMSKAFRDFMSEIMPSKATLKDIRAIAGGVAAVFSIIWTVIKGVASGFKSLFEAVGGGKGDFLDFAAGIAIMIKDFDAWLKKTNSVEEFFVGLGQILAVPIELLKGVASLIGGLFSGFRDSEAGGVADAISGTTDKLGRLEGVADRIRGFFAGLGGIFRSIGEKIGDGLSGIGDAIGDALTSEAFGPALDAIDTGLLGAITLMLAKFFKGGMGIDITGGAFSQIAGVLDGVTGSLSALQTSLKADALMKIGMSIGILAAALFVLSTIDPGDMRAALAAMAGGFAVLIGAMVIMMKFMGPVGIAQLYATSAALINMSIAILLLATALKIMSSMNLGTMLRGLFGMGIALGILVKVMQPLAAASPGMMKAAASLILVAVAMNLLAVALKLFATMSWEEMIKGLAGLTGTLIALSIGLKMMPPMHAEAVALVALGIAMNLLGVAMKIFATMSWEDMLKGMVGFAGTLGIISVAINTMPKTMALQAAALVLVAGAMVILGGALKIMGSMGWEEIAKGLVTMAGAMLILSVGLNSIGATGILGAAALVVTAKALLLLLPVMLAFSLMSWESIGKSMTMLAGVFIILGVAAWALAPVIPVILGLGIAILALGAGLALAGAGALLAATAFGIVVAAGSAGARVMVMLLQGIIDAIPPALKAFGKGIVQFAVAIGQGAPRIANAFGRILNNLLNQAIKAVPKIGKLFTTIIDTAAKVVINGAPKVARAGFAVLMALLNEIDRNMPKIVDKGASIVVKFIEGLGRNASKLANAAAGLVLDILHGVADAIRKNSGAFGEAGADIGLAIIEGIDDAIRAAAGRLAEAARDVAGNVVDGVRDFIGGGGPAKLLCEKVGKPMMEGWAGGIEEGSAYVMAEVDKTNKGLRNRLGEAMRDLEAEMSMDPNMSPTVTPVLDLAALTQEANKMSSILAVAPIIPTVSYQTAADISAATQAAPPSDDGSGGNGEGGSGGDTYVFEQHLHSPRPIDSVEAYRKGRSLLSQKKLEVSSTKKEE